MSAMLKQKLIDIANGFTKYGLWKGGSSKLSELDDVALTNLQSNDVLTYNGSVWVNDDNLHEYSTEEKVIGKWIDGKNVYEKTFVNLHLLNRADYIVDLSSLNIENVINAYGLCHRLANDGGSFDYNLPFFESTGLYVNMRYNKNQKNYSIWCSDSSGTYTANLTIQYTKQQTN